jgi:thioredoxin-like negative regulator of GroEL
LPRPLIQLRHAQGVLAMRRQRWTQAEHALRQALAHGVTAGWVGHMASVSIELGECLLAMGRLEEADQVCATGLSWAETGGYADLAAVIRYVLARIAHARGDSATARSLTQAALEQVRRSRHYRTEEIAAWVMKTFGPAQE